MGLLNNELEFKFRGGCDALGPEVLLFLTTFVKKHINLQNLTFIIDLTGNLGQILPMPIIRFFNQTPGSEKREFLCKNSRYTTPAADMLQMGSGPKVAQGQGGPGAQVGPWPNRAVGPSGSGP